MAIVRVRQESKRAISTKIHSFFLHHISIIPIEFRYDLRMTKELIPRQFHDSINQMIAAIILNSVRFGNEVSIQQCVSFHFDLTPPQSKPYSFFN